MRILTFKVHFLKSSSYFQESTMTITMNTLLGHTVPSFKRFYQTTTLINEQENNRCAEKHFVEKFQKQSESSRE